MSPQEAERSERTRVTSIAVAILIAVAVVVLALRCPLAPYLVFAFASASLLHVLDRPSRMECWLTLGCGILLAGARQFVHHDVIANEAGWYSPLAFLGMGSLLVTASPLAWLAGAQYRRRFEMFVHRAALAFMAIIAGVFVGRTNGWLPVTYDTYLYAFDWSFGLQLSFVLGRAFTRFPWLQRVEYLVYFGLPLGLALTASQTRLYSTGRTLLIFMVAAVIGFGLYACMPASGPAYLFPSEYPFHEPALGEFAVRATVLPGDAPRNAMPSLHFTWALLAFWNSRCSSPVVRAVISTFTCLTFLGTLGWGQHYLIDLLVAVPLSVAVQAACAPSLQRATRLSSIGIGAATTAAWILLLHIAVPLFQIPMVLTWLLSTLTVTSSIWLHRRLLASALDVGATPEAKSVASAARA